MLKNMVVNLLAFMSQYFIIKLIIIYNLIYIFYVKILIDRIIDFIRQHFIKKKSLAFVNNWLIINKKFFYKIWKVHLLVND